MKATGHAARLRCLDAFYCWAIENGVRRVAEEKGNNWTVEEDIEKVKEKMFFDDKTMETVFEKVLLKYSRTGGTRRSQWTPRS